MASENGGGVVTVPDTATETIPQIRLTPLARQRVFVPLVGVTPVIPHKWSEKALRMMREAQSGSKIKPKHDPKDPEDDAEGACYYLPDGSPGLPAVSFKAAIVGACRLFSGITMASAKAMFWVEGVGPDQLVALEGERYIREDTPRNSNGSPDLRYRYCYWPWNVTLSIRFLPSQIDLDSVLALVDAGGMGGVGDWRPSAPKSLTGTYGQFAIDNTKTVQVF